MDYLSEMDRAFTLRLALILTLIALIVLLLDIQIVRKRITLPINALSRCAGSFAYDTEEDRQNDLRLLDALNIHTGDEIEDVYRTLQSVTHDSYVATSNLVRAQTIIHNRDGMITAMALKNTRTTVLLKRTKKHFFSSLTLRISGKDLPENLCSLFVICL